MKVPAMPVVLLRVLTAVAIACAASGCIIGKPGVLGVLNSYPESEGVRIPRGTMWLLGRLAESDGDYSEFAADIKELEAYECSDVSSIAAIEDDVARLADKRRMELLIETCSEGERCSVYGLVPAESDAPLKEVLICTFGPGDCSIVFIRGRFDLAGFAEKELKTDKPAKKAHAE